MTTIDTKLTDFEEEPEEPTNGQQVPDEVEDIRSPVSLRRLSRESFTVPICGTAPLIVQRWSEKAKRQMLESQQTKARQKKEPKNPEAEYEASKYHLLDGRDGFPAAGFKAAIVHASRLFDKDKSLTQVLLKQSFSVGGEVGKDGDKLVHIIGDVTMREDTPRAQGTAQLRYRAAYWPWTATLHVTCIKGQFDHESILALVDAAGIGGIGEWRPTSPKSATGTFGMFEVVDE